jgi:hypothetical protein
MTRPHGRRLAMTFTISGTVADQDVCFANMEKAVDALRKYRELVATGKVSVLWIHYGPDQICLDELKCLAGER